MAHTTHTPKPDDELCCGVIFQQLDGGESILLLFIVVLSNVVLEVRWTTNPSATAPIVDTT